MIFNLILFCVSLAGLVSSNKLIEGASHVSVLLGVPTFLIGLTVIGIGSSAPEMVIAGRFDQQTMPPSAMSLAQIQQTFCLF